VQIAEYQAAETTLARLSFDSLCAFRNPKFIDRDAGAA
jgi:hypothetical protein